ncbi:hypothetical protein TrCOL_g3162 [Triparma columacea]|uniref:TMEM205-like domain-containing protein n=1 Tax=Triparma columacea TaxID=722753 RepID=A0A9W7GHB3_9STRA|nr:hypothetical protein TrCOL_g3162 [Triparma columacea]
MIWNTPSFRIIALITPVTFLAYRSTLPFQLPFQYPLAILHLSSWGINVGTNFYTTFVAGITMFKALPRREFGKLQAKLFPKFFLLCTLTAFLQLSTLRNLSSTVSPSPTFFSLFCSLSNLLYLEPKSTSIMSQRHRLEDKGEASSEEYKSLKSEFGKLHGMSSLMNLGALVGLLVHGALIARKLVAP